MFLHRWATPNRATLSIVGMYNHDPDLFDDLTFPEDAPDKDTVIVPEILKECAEMELQYPDADYMKAQFSIFSAKYYDEIERFIRAANAEYNPIENYDRHESRSRTGAHSDTHTEHNTGEGTSNSAQVENEHSDSTGNSNSTHNVAGYNANTLVAANQDVGTESNSENRGATSNAKNTTNTEENKSLTMQGNENEVEQSHIHGNIGVTTAQQMISAELDLLPRINVVNFIVSLFKQEFCILTY